MPETSVERGGSVTSWKDIKIIKSSKDNVTKLVFTNDAIAEAVLYKYPTYSERTVICCSTQSGCPMGCSFCGTGSNFIRNLTAIEIIDQVVEALKHTNTDDYAQIKKLQIMFMSMGEPLLNMRNLRDALIYLHAYVSNADLLVSTSAPNKIGAMVELIDLAVHIPKIGLQFSVHESTDEARKKLIKGHTLSLEQINECGLLFAQKTNRRPFFNYCVHDKNCTDEDIARLVAVLPPNTWEVTLSVICEKDETIKSSVDRQLDLIAAFNSKMMAAGYSTRIFNPSGQDDIGGGCGQLWYVQKFLRERGEINNERDNN